MVSIKWSKKATRNVKEIKEYISIESAYYAKRMINNIIKACRLLQQHPEIGKPLLEQQGKLLRRINVKSYQVVYT